MKFLFTVMNPTHDIDALCSGNKLQRDLQCSHHVVGDLLIDQTPVRLRQLDTGHIQGQNGNLGKDVPAFGEYELQGLRVHGDDHVDLSLAVTQAHQVGHKLPVFGAGVSAQVQIFKKLVPDAYPS